MRKLEKRPALQDVQDAFMNQLITVQECLTKYTVLDTLSKYHEHEFYEEIHENKEDNIYKRTDLGLTTSISTLLTIIDEEVKELSDLSAEYDKEWVKGK